MITRASARGQTIVVSHSDGLVSALRQSSGKQVVLTKQLGETIVSEDEAPSWHWPSR